MFYAHKSLYQSVDAYSNSTEAKGDSSYFLIIIRLVLRDNGSVYSIV